MYCGPLRKNTKFKTNLKTSNNNPEKMKMTSKKNVEPIRENAKTIQQICKKTRVSLPSGAVLNHKLDCTKTLALVKVSQVGCSAVVEIGRAVKTDVKSSSKQTN